MDPATLALLVSLAITGIKTGYSYYESVQYALKQASIRQSMIEADQAQLAIAMHNNFPNVTFDEWLSIVKNANIAQTQNNLPDKKSNLTTYAPYIVIGLLFVFWLYKEMR